MIVCGLHKVTGDLDLKMTSGHLLVLANLHIKFEDSRSKHTKVLTTLTYLHPRSQ